MFGYPFHHIGIACDDIEQAASCLMEAYQVRSDSGTVYDPEQDAYVRLFNAGEPGAIELVSGPAVSAVRTRDISYYHVCYQLPDIEAAIARAQSVGALCVSQAKPAVLFADKKIAFVYTQLGLVEFLEAR